MRRGVASSGTVATRARNSLGSDESGASGSRRRTDEDRQTDGQTTTDGQIESTTTGGGGVYRF